MRKNIKLPDLSQDDKAWSIIQKSLIPPTADELQVDPRPLTKEVISYFCFYGTQALAELISYYYLYLLVDEKGIFGSINRDIMSIIYKRPRLFDLILNLLEKRQEGLALAFLQLPRNIKFLSRYQNLLKQNLPQKVEALLELIEVDLSAEFKIDPEQATPFDQETLGAALHEAARTGSKDALSWLIKHGAQPDALNEQFNSVLHSAMLNQYSFELFKHLLDLGASPYIENRDGYNTLHLAVLTGNVNALTCLLHRRFSYKKLNKQDQTILHLAAMTNQYSMILLIRENISADDFKFLLAAMDRNGDTPLHLAAMYSSWIAFRTLIKCGANPTILNKHDGRTALHVLMSTQKNQIVPISIEDKETIKTELQELIEYFYNHIGLIKSGTDFFIFRNFEIETVSPDLYDELQEFKFTSHVDILPIDQFPKKIQENLRLDSETNKKNKFEILEDCFSSMADQEKIDVLTMPDIFGTTLLHSVLTAASVSISAEEKMASESDAFNNSLHHLETASADISKWLYAHGVSSDWLSRAKKPAEEKEKPKDLAMEFFLESSNIFFHESKLPPLGELRKRLGNPRALNTDRQTALHIAVQHDGSSQYFDFLISLGMPWEIADINGNTALHLAALSDGLVYLKCLLKKGMSLKTVNNNRHTVLHLAALSNRFTIIEYLKKNTDPKDWEFLLSAEDINGDTALHLAANYGCWPAFNSLISSGAKPMTFNKYNQRTSLHAVLAGSRRYDLVTIALDEKEIIEQVVQEWKITGPLVLFKQKGAFFLYEHTILIDSNTRINPVERVLWEEEEDKSEDLLKFEPEPSILLAKDIPENLQKKIGFDLYVEKPKLSYIESGSTIKSSLTLKSHSHKYLHLHTALNFDDDRCEFLSRGFAAMDEKEIYTALRMPDVFGNTLLHLADYSPKTLNYLLDQGAPPDLLNRRGETVLQIATAKGWEKIIALFSKRGASTPSSDGQVASSTLFDRLEQAWDENDAVSLKTLLQQAADNFSAKENQYILYHLLVIIGSKKLIEVILDEELLPELNSIDSNGNTPLHLAVICNFPEAADAFLKAGARIDLLNNDHLSPLHLVVMDDNTEILARLLSESTHEALNLLNRDKRNILQLAVLKRSEVMVNMILHYQINLDNQDWSGDTALHLAVMTPKCLMFSIIALLEIGADKTIRNKLNYTAEEICPSLSLFDTILAKELVISNSTENVHDELLARSLLERTGLSVKAWQGATGYQDHALAIPIESKRDEDEDESSIKQHLILLLEQMNRLSVEFRVDITSFQDGGIAKLKTRIDGNDFLFHSDKDRYNYYRDMKKHLELIISRIERRKNEFQKSTEFQSADEKSRPELLENLTEGGRSIKVFLEELNEAAYKCPSALSCISRYYALLRQPDPDLLIFHELHNGIIDLWSAKIVASYQDALENKGLGAHVRDAILRVGHRLMPRMFPPITIKDQYIEEEIVFQWIDDLIIRQFKAEYLAYFNKSAVLVRFAEDKWREVVGIYNNFLQTFGDSPGEYPVLLKTLEPMTSNGLLDEKNIVLSGDEDSYTYYLNQEYLLGKTKQSRLQFMAQCRDYLISHSYLDSFPSLPFIKDGLEAFKNFFKAFHHQTPESEIAVYKAIDRLLRWSVVAKADDICAIFAELNEYIPWLDERILEKLINYYNQSYSVRFPQHKSNIPVIMTNFLHLKNALKPEGTDRTVDQSIASTFELLEITHDYSSLLKNQLNEKFMGVLSDQVIKLVVTYVFPTIMDVINNPRFTPTNQKEKINKLKVFKQKENSSDCDAHAVMNVSLAIALINGNSSLWFTNLENRFLPEEKPITMMDFIRNMISEFFHQSDKNISPTMMRKLFKQLKSSSNISLDFNQIDVTLVPINTEIKAHIGVFDSIEQLKMLENMIGIFDHLQTGQPMVHPFLISIKPHWLTALYIDGRFLVCDPADDNINYLSAVCQPIQEVLTDVNNLKSLCVTCLFLAYREFKLNDNQEIKPEKMFLQQSKPLLKVWLAIISNRHLRSVLDYNDAIKFKNVVTALELLGKQEVERPHLIKSHLKLTKEIQKFGLFSSIDSGDIPDPQPIHTHYF